MERLHDYDILTFGITGSCTVLLSSTTCKQWHMYSSAYISGQISGGATVAQKHMAPTRWKQMVAGDTHTVFSEMLFTISSLFIFCLFVWMLVKGWHDKRLLWRCVSWAAYCPSPGVFVPHFVKIDPLSLKSRILLVCPSFCHFVLEK